METTRLIGRPLPVKKSSLVAIAMLALTDCMSPEPVPGWVLICHDTGGGEGCPPSDTTDAQGASDVDKGELGPEE